MTLLAWLLVILALAAVGLWLKRDWEERRQAEEQAQAEKADAGSNQPSASPLVPLREGVAQLLSAKQPPMGAKFRQWMTQALDKEPDLRSWLAGLTDEQLDALTTRLDAFAQEMGFQLRWLLDQEVAQQPALAQSLTRVVADYCRACRHSVNLQEELEVYKTIRHYQQAPNSQPNRALSEALFGKLLEQGLTPVKVAEHLALPEKERRRQVVSAVQQAATEKPLVFQKLVKEVVFHHNGATNGAVHHN
jgi:ribosomal protein S13